MSKISFILVSSWFSVRFIQTYSKRQLDLSSPKKVMERVVAQDLCNKNFEISKQRKDVVKKIT